MPGYEPVTILVGLLAGSVALLGALVSRSNTVSAFRQNWINDQRSDIATISASATIISSNILADTSVHFVSFAVCYSRMILRTNPNKEEEWFEVLENIRELYEDLWNLKGSQHNVTDRLRIIEYLSRWPLKDNWSKTKHGEKEYWISGLIAGLAIIICFAVAVYQPGSEKEGQTTTLKISVTK